MAESAAYLVDHILPHVAVRQWVLSFPTPLRSLFAVSPELLTTVLPLLNHARHTHLIEQAGVRCDANDRQGIERLCRYTTRPAIASERLSINREGNAVLKLKPVLSLPKGRRGATAPPTSS